MAKMFAIVCLSLVLGLLGRAREVVGQCGTQGGTCGVNCALPANANKHSLCLTPPATSVCSPTVQALDADTQALILSLHNDYRSVVRDGGESRGAPGPQPAAGPATTGAVGTSSLPPLTWDDNLAIVAQAWAKQCQFASDTLRNVLLTTAAGTGTPGYVGQNAYARLDFASAIPADSPFVRQTFVRLALSTWYNEVQNFNSANVGSYKFSTTYGKYSQMMWGPTTAVGCGYVQWNYPNNRIARILFCDYGPGGNYPNQPMYTPASSTDGVGEVTGPPGK